MAQTGANSTAEHERVFTAVSANFPSLMLSLGNKYCRPAPDRMQTTEEEDDEALFQGSLVTSDPDK